MALSVFFKLIEREVYEQVTDFISVSGKDVAPRMLAFIKVIIYVMVLQVMVLM